MTGRGTGRQPRGFAVLLVLWVLLALALLATRMIAVGRGEVRLAADLKDSAMAEAAADGAVHEAIYHLVAQDHSGWAPDRRIHVTRIGPCLVAVRIEDEAGKINPNQAKPALLQTLLEALAVDPVHARSLAAAIVEWRSPAANPAAALRADALYRAAGLDHGPAHVPFRTLDELGGVLGMRAALLPKLKPHLTLYSAADPDPKRADPLVRQVMLHYRAAFPATRPVPILMPTGPIGPNGLPLGIGPGIPNGQAAPGTGLTVRVEARSTGPDAASFGRIATIRIGGKGGYAILAWSLSPAG